MAGNGSLYEDYLDSEIPDCSLCHNLTNKHCHHTVGNDTPQSMADPWSSKPELRLNLCVYILCMVGGIIGNISVILIMIRQKTSRKLHSDTWKTNLFLLSLSVSDLLLVMVAVPTQLLHYFSVQVDETGVFCKISEYFRVLSSTAAILNLTAVTLERFVVIVYPYHSRSLCTLGNCRKVVTTVWVLSIFLAIPVIWTKDVFTYYYANCTDIVSVTYCNDTDDIIGIYFTWYQVIVTFILPSIVMISCYSSVINSLRRATNNMVVMTNRFIMETALKMGVLRFNNTVYWVRVGLFLLPFLHSIINPLIYVTMSKLFRKQLIKMMGRVFHLICCVRPVQARLEKAANEGEPTTLNLETDTKVLE